MAFRRDKAKATESQAWRRFRDANADLLFRSGLPAAVCESQSLFIDLLENGHIHYHEDPLHFDVRQLAPDQRAALLEAIVQYRLAGFPDPGMAVAFRERVEAEVERHGDEQWRGIRGDGRRHARRAIDGRGETRPAGRIGVERGPRDDGAAGGKAHDAQPVGRHAPCGGALPDAAVSGGA